MSWYNSLGNAAKVVFPVSYIANSGIYDAAKNAITGDPGGDAEKRRKELLQQQAEAAGQFAGTGQANYNTATAQGQNALTGLQRLAQGQDSVSAEQLRQGLQQNQASQMSMAAGASPQNASSAARTAAIMMGRQGAGLAGQQATAGLQERNQAQQQYGALLGMLRGQDANVALGSRGNAMTGYGATNAGTPEKSWMEKYGPALQAAVAAMMMASDRRLKTEIRDGDAAANKAIAGLRAYAYKYKDEGHGKGEQLSGMAQDYERAGLRSVVVDTPAGKMVHGAKLAGANTAMIAALGRRVAELEGKGGAK